MQDGCKVYIDSYMALNGSCFMVTLNILKNNLFGGRPNRIPGPWHSECSQPLVYFILPCVRTRMNKNSLK